ncbi:hypothetical protein L873DRAFT_1361030 [Choiromyces venosus 120613-1]|uniref:SMP domain-containing protein n=1 Tax=Choiromyces venosus 120613-1 TaxID=1336337 RepID=A0A3N4K7S0_9PEZI|nr:hypothetical protein L873DRAFT_1361030 [Choiromyces venosus 120613-1]
MAQSLYMKQQEFQRKADEITRKAPEEITQDDARELQSKESRARGGIRPPKGSLSAEAQSIADQNAKPGSIGGDAYVTHEDAAAAQSAESRIFGGQIPKGSLASQMKSAAGELDNAVRGDMNRG